jgi:hypothetical protein
MTSGIIPLPEFLFKSLWPSTNSLELVISVGSKGGLVRFSPHPMGSEAISNYLVSALDSIRGHLAGEILTYHGTRGHRSISCCENIGKIEFVFLHPLTHG